MRWVWGSKDSLSERDFLVIIAPSSFRLSPVIRVAAGGGGEEQRRLVMEAWES